MEKKEQEKRRKKENDAMEKADNVQNVLLRSFDPPGGNIRWVCKVRLCALEPSRFVFCGRLSDKLASASSLFCILRGRLDRHELTRFQKMHRWRRAGAPLRDIFSLFSLFGVCFPVYLVLAYYTLECFV